MNARQRILSTSLLLLVGSLASGQTPKSDDARIETLIRKLGSPAFVQREQARKELEAIGLPALDALRRASKTSDVETSRRLADLIRNFEDQLLTKQILTPKEIHFKVKDVPIPDAIDELAKISGYPIQFLGDALKFTGKKITLDTGKTTFWQALDQLCAKADLMERVEFNVASSQSIYSRKMKNGMARPIYVPQQSAQTGPILVTNRGEERSSVNFAGSLKTELRVKRDAKSDELILTFIVGAEPRLQNGSVLGKPILDKAFDMQGRKLHEAVDLAKPELKGADAVEMTLDENDILQPVRRFTEIRIRDKDQAAKAIKEMAGRLTYQLDLQHETLARIGKVMDATGKSVPTTNGGTMKINAIRKEGGDILVDVSLENTMASPLGNNIIINGGAVIIRGNANVRGIVIGPAGVRMNGDGSTNDLPELVDAKGQKFKLVNVTDDGYNFVNGQSSRNVRIVYQPNPGQAEPRELVLVGTRTHTIAVPFRFENVPLP